MGVIAASPKAIKPQAVTTSESQRNARYHSIHMHYGIHLCEPYLREISTKFTSTAYSHVCWHVAVNMNFTRNWCEFNE